MVSASPGAPSPPRVKIGSSIVTVVEFTVTVSPLTSILPAKVAVLSSAIVNAVAKAFALEPESPPSAT